MHLGADRIDVIEGERVHAVFIVGTSSVAIDAAGGLDHLGHELEDVGFRDVRVWDVRPRAWFGGSNVATPSMPEWLVWIAATPSRSASYRRELTEDLRVADAWAADGEGEPAITVTRPLHPYAIAWAAPMRIAGILHAFGEAYPLAEGGA